jgi:putative ABC transport system permease protein
MAITIRNQPSMGFARTMRLTVHAIRYRLFRSVLTVMVVAVAIAFLMNVVSESLIRQRLGVWAAEQLRTSRLAAAWASRPAGPVTPEVIAPAALADEDRGFRAAGLQFDAATAQAVAKQAAMLVQTRVLEETLKDHAIRKDLAARLDLLPAQITADALWRLLRRPRHAAWFGDRIGTLSKPAGDWSATRLVALARLKEREAALDHCVRLGVDAGGAGGLLGLGERMSWLVLVSMLVCVVGIANAMLMTVTERFREIATLKCLGALDTYIMLSFVTEACMLGVVGGLAGGVAGALLGIARMLAEFGALVWMAIPALHLLAAGIAAAVMGVLLSALAAVYPSFRAARLAPMEAMRIE